MYSICPVILVKLSCNGALDPIQFGDAVPAFALAELGNRLRPPKFIQLD